MASIKPSYGWSEASAAEMKKIPLPAKLLCRECKKFKSPPQFSNKQLNEYRFKVQMRQRITPISAQLRCRNCTGDQTQELLCTGPCDMWKGLEEFSKNQRRRPENAWCESCTQWKEANEPGVTPMPPPNNLLSPDEDDELVENETGFSAYTPGDIEGGIYGDDDGIHNSLATTSIADDDAPGYIGKGGKSVDYVTQITSIPGYSTRPRNALDILQSPPSLSNPYDARSDFTSDGENSEVETGSQRNSTKDKAEHSGSENSWPEVNKKTQKPGIPYNAWDNAGKMHGQYRVPSQSTALSGMTGSSMRPESESTLSSHQGGWATANIGRKDDRFCSTGQTGAWPKASLATRNPAPQFPALSRPVKQNIYDDDDDSPDEM